jgi:hypothetical protein
MQTTWTNFHSFLCLETCVILFDFHIQTLSRTSPHRLITAEEVH